MNSCRLFARATLVLLALAAAGCTAVKPLPSGFYKPAGAPAAKLPIRVAVISEGAPKEAFRGDGLIVLGKITLASYPQEVAAMLGDVYRSVKVVPTMADASDADIRVHLGTDYPRHLTLDFRDAVTGEDLARLTEPGVANANTGPIKMGFAVPYNLFFIPTTLGIIGLVELGMASSHANRLNADIQQRSSLALNNLRQRILVNDELILAPAQKRELQEFETQGAAALAAGDPIGALLAYQQALLKVLPGSARALALQGKAVQAVTQMPDAPPVPAAAQELMTRGRAAMAMARAPEDLGLAGKDMEKALAQAPWWATGHLNTALVLEGAGHWSQAAAHLQMYLQLEPQAADREKLRLKIAELQLRQERGDKPVGAR